MTAHRRSKTLFRRHVPAGNILVYSKFIYEKRYDINGITPCIYLNKQGRSHSVEYSTLHQSLCDHRRDAPDEPV